MLISDSIERYLEDASIGSAYTRRTYRTSMTHFQAYLTERKLPPADTEIDRLDVDRLLAFANYLLDESGVGQRTLHTYLAGLVGWVQFLQVRGWLPLTPQELARFNEGIKRVRKNQRPPDLVPHPQARGPGRAGRRRLRAPPTPRGRRTRVPGQAARHRHCRSAALHRSACGRTGEDPRKQLDADEKAAWIIGKRGKARRIYFDQQAWGAIHRYLQARQVHDGAAQRPLAELPVFARHDKRAGAKILPLTTMSIQNTIRDLADRADLAAKGITPHALRHYFATRIYQTTHDLAVTQTALGHSSPNTTRIYAKLEDDAVRSAHQKAFGRGQDTEAE